MFFLRDEGTEVELDRQLCPFWAGHGEPGEKMGQAWGRGNGGSRGRSGRERWGGSGEGGGRGDGK